MLITDKFVVLNYPKTGSTFVRNVIKDLHQSGPFRSVLVKWGFVKPHFEDVKGPRFSLHDKDPVKTTQHQVYAQVPDIHKHKPIVTVIRNPFDRLVSVYEYRDWVKHPPASIEEIRDKYPTYPDLDFAGFVSMRQEFLMKSFLGDIKLNMEIGPTTVQFIRFYARDPKAYLSFLHEGMDLTTDREKHFPEIEFLHTENLNADLHSFLMKMGYPGEKIKFILDRPPVNTTKRQPKPYFTQSIIDDVIHKERLLLGLFPEYLPNNGR